MELDLPLDENVKSRLQARARHDGVDVATFVALAVQEKLAAKAEDAPRAPIIAAGQLQQAFIDWADSHPQVPRLDTNRDSIYPDDHALQRGE